MKMYYEEKQIDGIWHFRHSPGERWKLMGFVRLNQKLRNMERERDEMRREAEEFRDDMNCHLTEGDGKFSWENAEADSSAVAD